VYDADSDDARIVRVLAPEAISTPLAALGGRLYFFDLSPDGICALWSTYGTASGTVRVKHVGSGPGGAGYGGDHCPDRFVRHAGALFFSACGPLAGCELWRSDGTTAGTNRVADLVPGPGSSYPSDLASIGDRLYLQACTPAHGCEPWVTEGSAAGLHRLADISPGAASSAPAEFTHSERLVYFAADDGTGAELWAMPLEIFYDGFEGGSTVRWGGGS
jgi:ELWxxDGT repeat protein